MTVVAPTGFGKTRLLRQRATNWPGLAVYLSVAQCANHAGLFLDLLIRELGEVAPRLNLAPLVACKAHTAVEDYPEQLPFVLQGVLKASSSGPVLLALDDLDQLDAQDHITATIGALAHNHSSTLHLNLASRQSLDALLPVDSDALQLTHEALVMSVDEVSAILNAHVGSEVPQDLIHRAHARLGAWPAAMSLFLVMARELRSVAELTRLFDEQAVERESFVELVVTRLVASQRPYVKWLMKVISILEQVDEATALALFGHSELLSARLTPAQRRLVTQLPPAQLRRGIQVLRDAQLLVAAGDEHQGLWCFNPLVRDALKRLFERENPVAFREVHRRAAEYALATEAFSTQSVEKLVAAEDFDRVLEVLEPEADELFATGYHRGLIAWLRRLEQHYTATGLPLWVSYFLARGYARRGEWERARQCLDACRKRLKGDRKAITWHARLYLGHAELARRRGALTDARTWCQRGLNFLRTQLQTSQEAEVRRETLRLKLTLLALLGQLKIDAGMYPKAVEVFGRACELAREAELPREEAHARDKLGWIAARCGHLRHATEHYEQALDLIAADDTPELKAGLSLHLGQVKTIIGDFDDAETLIARAIALRVDLGHTEGVVVAMSAMGLLQVAAGRLPEADRTFERVSAMLDSVGSVVVRGTCLARLARFRAFQGKTVEALVFQRRAEEVLGSRLRVERPLMAMQRLTTMEIEQAKGESDRALHEFERAVELYHQMEARHEVAWLYWRAAALHHSLFSAGKRDTPESVVLCLEKACEEANREGYRFAPESRYEELLRIGCTLGHPATVLYCTEALTRLGVEVPEADVASLISDVEALSARYEHFHRRLDGHGGYRVTTRRGEQNASATDIELIETEQSAHALVVSMMRQEMNHRGRVTALGQKRIILPLLAHFLCQPESAFTVPELAAEVWNSPNLDKSMRTKVKVAVSRLRNLLGREHTVIVTGRRVEGTRSVVTYGLSPEVDFYLLEKLPEQD